jgi:hypothetical protein
MVDENLKIIIIKNLEILNKLKKTIKNGGNEAWNGRFCPFALLSLT